MNNVRDPAQHQRGERIVSRGRVKDRRQLFGNKGRHGMQAPHAASEDAPLHSPLLACIFGFHRWRATTKFVMAKA